MDGWGDNRKHSFPLIKRSIEILSIIDIDIFNSFPFSFLLPHASLSCTSSRVRFPFITPFKTPVDPKLP